MGVSLARLLGIVALLGAAGVLLALGWLFVIYPDSDGPVSSQSELIIDVTEGTSLRELADELAAGKVIDRVDVWVAYMRIKGLDRHLRQGKIRLQTPMTPEEVARYTTTGLGRIQVRITIPEGFNRFDVAQRLEEFGVCPGEDFLEATEDPSILASYGIDADDAEGYLFPDTYDFDDQTKPRRVVERMLANWTRRYEEIEVEYADELAALDQKWSTQEIVTLASIVEKEAVVDAERARIAGVFRNRLSSMKFLPRRRLQADPTVQYGCIAMPTEIPSCEGYDGSITRAMLEDTDNPYNTYRHSGLPPGPISNPGKAALVAVIDPEDHSYYYFVARGHGRHQFSKTLRQHNVAVRKHSQR